MWMFGCLFEPWAVIPITGHASFFIVSSLVVAPILGCIHTYENGVYHFLLIQNHENTYYNETLTNRRELCDQLERRFLAESNGSFIYGGPHTILSDVFFKYCV